MQTAQMSIFIRAPIERVWGLLTDYAGYARIPQVKAARVLRPGDAHPAGVGAIREVTVLGTTFEELIVEFDAPRRLGYRIIRSRPLKFEHELGLMELSARDGGTQVEWQTTFAARVPVVGGLLTRVLGVVIQRTFNKILLWLKDDLEREAEPVTARSA
jgi:hypothetical protein